MSAVKRQTLVSVDDYLASELDSQVKQEYLGGVVYAMPAARNLHSDISGNIFGYLHTRLRGKPCRPYYTDTKIRVRLPTHVLFYYPDTSVTCEPNAPEDSFQDRPVVIFEVLSKKTRRIDEGEQKNAYLTLPSLMAYVLV